MADQLDELLAELKGVPGQNVEAPMLINDVENFTITAGKLRAFCDKYPSHPLSSAKRRSVHGMPDHKEVIVERPDLLAIAEGKDIDFVTNTEVRKINGVDTKVRVQRKKLVPLGKAVNPTPTPTTVSAMSSKPSPTT
jgi:hypothetical protein